jgi:hypothetical protein
MHRILFASRRLNKYGDRMGLRRYVGQISKYILTCGPDNIDGLVTRHGLDSPGIE